ncbi:hypothetical protein HanPI659440_Chr13g0502861 [Helianthus annuus]|nr:hypothetical protein HanPI659440_Chr13g0502861 [Helianthus annuus]
MSLKKSYGTLSSNIFTRTLLSHLHKKTLLPQSWTTTTAVRSPAPAVASVGHHHRRPPPPSRLHQSRRPASVYLCSSFLVFTSNAAGSTINLFFCLKIIFSPIVCGEL